MSIEIREEPPSALEEYAGVSIAFEVESVFDVADARDASGRFVLTERRLEVPYIKNYDDDGGETPAEWARRFDVSNWGFYGAWIEGWRAGGAAVVFDTPGLNLLEERADIALLWDIRVAAEARGRGVGSALFRAAESWAKARGCRRLKIETQNINVAACRFYESRGCVLAEVNRNAYPQLPNEIQLLWHKEL